jgi:hypothetical protein
MVQIAPTNDSGKWMLYCDAIGEADLIMEHREIRNKDCVFKINRLATLKRFSDLAVMVEYSENPFHQE